MAHDHSALQRESFLVAAGRSAAVGAPLNIPIVPASNFVLGGERAYVRDDGTPAWDALEEIVGGLEGGHAVVFSSGMAAIAAVFDQLAVGSIIVLPDDCYQGVVGLAQAGVAKGMWTLERIDISQTGRWVDACERADLIWIESPSNPMLCVADLTTICAAPRKPGTLIAVDNTFATPLNQRPLAIGADISIQSATKYIGGHSDLLAGVASTAAPALLAALRRSRLHAGATPGALEMFLAVRGARTMALRLERAQQSATRLAKWLAQHPAVITTRYPGLASHPTHAIAREQLRGFGTIISFDVAGDAARADAVCLATRLIVHATSLGAVESTIERRGAVPGQQHLPAALLRLSVGIENCDDLIADLDQALSLAASQTGTKARNSAAR